VDYDYQSISSNNVCLSSSVPGSGLSSAAVAGICVGAVFLLVSAVVTFVVVIYRHHRHTAEQIPQDVSITYQMI